MKPPTTSTRLPGITVVEWAKRGCERSATVSSSSKPVPAGTMRATVATGCRRSSSTTRAPPATTTPKSGTSVAVWRMVGV
ncbi:MAG: hypothetical protein M5U28_31785 [Sandaracinaceae bacterium]|nr:hypothetical protein [Sandaracinaceae bacterium]